MHFKGRKSSLLYATVTGLLACLLSLGSFFVYFSPVQAEDVGTQQEVYLSFDPSELKVKVGEEFWVRLVVENVRQLAAVSLEIKYEPGVVKCLPVTQEQPLEKGEVFTKNYYPVKNEIDSQNGILRFAALVELPFKDGFNGTGTLAKMKFKALQPGSPVLSVKSIELEPVKENDKISGKARGELEIKVVPSVEQGAPSPGSSPGTSQQGPGDTGSLSTGTETQTGNNAGSDRDQSPPSQPEKDQAVKQPETVGEKGGASDGVSFSDLPAGHWAFQEVNALVKKGIIKGYDDGTFRPQQNISRQEFAALVGRITGLEDKTIPGYILTYKDADQIAGWARPSVTAATYMGIFRGDAGRKFNPQAHVSRAEITAVLIRLLGKEKEDAQLQPDEIQFNDIKNHWAKESITLAQKLRLVSGYADGSFKPQGEATRAEVSAMLVRLLKYRQLI